MSKRQKNADKKRLERIRKATRRGAPLAQTPNSVADRQHFIETNMPEALRHLKRAPSGHVIAICDSRDPIGRQIILGGGQTEQQIRAHEASMIGTSLIPTFFISLPVEAAIEVLAHVSPNTSETMEMFSTTHRFIIAITGRGTALRALPTKNGALTPATGTIVVTDGSVAEVPS